MLEATREVCGFKWGVRLQAGTLEATRECAASSGDACVRLRAGTLVCGFKRGRLCAASSGDAWKQHRGNLPVGCIGAFRPDSSNPV